MTADPTREYSLKLFAFAEMNRLRARRELAALNEDATEFDHSQDLVLYKQAVDREMAALLTPHLDTIAATVVEYRQMAGIDQPAPPPESRAGGARRLDMNPGGVPRVAPFNWGRPAPPVDPAETVPPSVFTRTQEIPPGPPLDTPDTGDGDSDDSPEVRP